MYMKKNPQFNKLLELVKERCKSDINIIAVSENQNDILLYIPNRDEFIFDYNRFNGFQNVVSHGRIEYRVNSVCPFIFHIHEYDNKPPYLEINLGNIISILHFV